MRAVVATVCSVLLLGAIALDLLAIALIVHGGTFGPETARLRSLY